MPTFAGPELEKKVERLKLRYVKTRERLIRRLSEGGPYGTIKLTPAQQFMRFVEMQPEDYELMIIKLNERYRGLPNAQNLVNKDLAAYMRSMLGIMLKSETSYEDTQEEEYA